MACKQFTKIKERKLKQTKPRNGEEGGPEIYKKIIRK